MFQVPNTRAKLFLGLALAGLITSAGTIGARANDRPIDSLAVAARDLDLSTHTGAATLRHRVIIAAYNVCERRNPAEALNSDTFTDCLSEAVHNASQQVETLIAAAQGATRMASAQGPSR